MIQTRTVVHIVDNTDVLSVRCFKPRKISRLGDIVPCSVLKVVKNKGAKTREAKTTGNSGTGTPSTYKRGDVVHALVINTSSRNSRGFKRNGIRTVFTMNCGILRVNAGKEGWVPVGTRIRGAVPRILRQKGWSNVVARAENLV